ncbi:MAG: acyl transferase [Nostocaceae cyanobacterium]|nr:acyl transferase [Nostocaceae cyanobacterium]
MTLLSTILSLFPTLVILMALGSCFWICFCPGIIGIAGLCFSLYAFPVMVYRIHEHFYPVKEGISYLGGNYSPWWGSHQIQVLYIAFPALETLLRLIPGAFSLWLRLWGAKVGQGVYWTPHLEIADRGLLEIGDRVVFGHKIGIYAHAIKPRKADLMLYVKKVKIGNNVFLGAGSHLGPGVVVEDGTYLPVASNIYPNQKVNS